MVRILFALLLIGALRPDSHAQGIDAQAASIPQAQTSSVDALASYIKQNFATDTARIRAIYVWITHHVSYDLARLQAREQNKNSPPQPVADVLASRSAVCQGYSDLFVSLCKGVGIDAMVVGGYTKIQDKVSPIPHAWAAASLGGQWYLFDPTWGAGYVQDNRFVKAFNNTFYKVPPAKLITDHMPFDPLYQFLSHPLTHKEFIDGTKATARTAFHYNDSLQQHRQLSSLHQMSAELRRLEAAGIQNDLLLERQNFLRLSLQSYASRDAFEEGGKAFNTAVDLFNQYIGHKNRQFTTIGDNDLRQMMDSIFQHVRLSRSLLSEAQPRTAEQRQARAGNMTQIDRFWVQLSKEKEFVERYFATDLAARRQLFIRR